MAFKRFKIYCRVAMQVPGLVWREHVALVNWARQNFMWPQKDIDPYDFIIKECRRTHELFTHKFLECDCALLRRRLVVKVYNNLAVHYLKGNI